MGQLAGDIEDAKWIQFVVDGVETPLYELNEVPTVAFNEGQIYRITCKSPTFKQTYFRVGK
jgi:hypothetical protein